MQYLFHVIPNLPLRMFCILWNCISATLGENFVISRILSFYFFGNVKSGPGTVPGSLLPVLISSTVLAPGHNSVLSPYLPYQ